MAMASVSKGELDKEITQCHVQLSNEIKKKKTRPTTVEDFYEAEGSTETF